MGTRQIVIPYHPRDQFKGFHARHQRWGCLVVHRRGGKTVAAINDLIRAAVTCKSANPLFAYIAPFRMQAKAVAWSYLKHYARPITDNVNEGELVVRLINKAEVRLFGADNADALRGLGFDGVLCDEFGDFAPSVFGSVIRPALSDKQGWCVFMGTPKGKNQFWDISEMARSNPDEWYYLHLPASKSDILPKSELDAVKKQISEDQYLQEYEVSFEAAILGAYYGKEMRALTEKGQIRDVPYDPSLPCFTAWDIGHSDDTSIWWFQVINNEIHVIDFFSESGGGPEKHGKMVMERKVPDASGRLVTPHYEKHFLPHDAKAATYSSNGKSTIEQLIAIFGFSHVGLAAGLDLQDGIDAARMTIPHCWFDATRCKDGIEALRQYEREYNEDTKAFRQTPKHNWASHPADAFRYLSISWRDQPIKRITHPERPLLIGAGNEATLEDMYAGARRQERRVRI